MIDQQSRVRVVEKRVTELQVGKMLSVLTRRLKVRTK